jgi:hypothetical protein
MKFLIVALTPKQSAALFRAHTVDFVFEALLHQFALS